MHLLAVTLDMTAGWCETTSSFRYRLVCNVVGNCPERSLAYKLTHTEMS